MWRVSGGGGESHHGHDVRDHVSDVDCAGLGRVTRVHGERLGEVLLNRQVVSICTLDFRQLSDACLLI